MLMYGADPGPFGDNQDGHAAAQAAMLHQKLTEAEAQFMREGQEANAAKAKAGIEAATGVVDAIQKCKDPNGCTAVDVATAAMKVISTLGPIVAAAAGPWAPVIGVLGGLLGQLFSSKSPSVPPLTVDDVKQAVQSVLAQFTLVEAKLDAENIASSLIAQVKAYGKLRNPEYPIYSSPEAFAQGWGGLFQRDRVAVRGEVQRINKAWQFTMTTDTEGAAPMTKLSTMHMFEENCRQTCFQGCRLSEVQCDDWAPPSCRTQLSDAKDSWKDARSALLTYAYVTMQLTVLKSVVLSNMDFIDKCANDQYETYIGDVTEFAEDTKNSIYKGQVANDNVRAVESCVNNSPWWPWEQTCTETTDFETMDCTYAYVQTVCGDNCNGNYKGADPKPEKEVGNNFEASDAITNFKTGCRKNQPKFGVLGMSVAHWQQPYQYWGTAATCDQADNLFDGFCTSIFSRYRGCAEANYCVLRPPSSPIPSEWTHPGQECWSNPAAACQTDGEKSCNWCGGSDWYCCNPARSYPPSHNCANVHFYNNQPHHQCAKSDGRLEDKLKKCTAILRKDNALWPESPPA